MNECVRVCKRTDTYIRDGCLGDFCSSLWADVRIFLPDAELRMITCMCERTVLQDGTLQVSELGLNKP